jgi:iron complex transport system substrate-binding protein
VAGCGKPQDAAGPSRVFVDSRGREVRVPSPPRRIVSIVPSLTELLFAVGAGGQVAGVTTYCDTPPEAKAKPKVGSIVVDGEALAALRPDLILTCARITPDTTPDLERRGYTVFSADPMSFEGIARTMGLLGELTGHAEQGRRAAEALLARVREVEARVASGGPAPAVYFEHCAEPLGTTGPESYAGDAIRRAGGRLIFDGGWRLVDWESVLARDPEVILVSHDGREGLERRAGWKDLRAVRSGRVHFVDKNSFLFPSPRLLRGLEEAARLIHAKSP